MSLTVQRTRVVRADAAAAWSVVSDMAGYADHAPGLSETAVVQGSELGSTRRCVDTSGADWRETCVAWDPGSRFTVDVDISSYPAKYRTLFSSFQGTWWVEELNDETVIGIRLQAELRGLAKGLRRQIEHRIAHDLDGTLESYERSIVSA